MIENMDFLKNSRLNDCEIGILANSWLKFKDVNKIKNIEMDMIFIHLSSNLIVKCELTELELIAKKLNRNIRGIVFSEIQKSISILLSK